MERQVPKSPLYSHSAAGDYLGELFNFFHDWAVVARRLRELFGLRYFQEKVLKKESSYTLFLVKLRERDQRKSMYTARARPLKITLIALGLGIEIKEKKIRPSTFVPPVPFFPKGKQGWRESSLLSPFVSFLFQTLSPVKAFPSGISILVISST